MTKLLEKAIEDLRKLSKSDQNVAAKFLLDFTNPDADLYTLSSGQVAEVEMAKKEVRKGKVATAAQMKRVWRRFGL